MMIMNLAADDTFKTRNERATNKQNARSFANLFQKDVRFWLISKKGVTFLSKKIIISVVHSHSYSADTEMDGFLDAINGRD